MTDRDLAFEVCKLVLQALFALFVAYQAVQWALARYKKEKMWDRRATAYTDVVSALSEMGYVSGQFSEHYADAARLSEQGQKTLVERYQNARRRLDDAAATAALILGEEAKERLNKLNRDVEIVSDMELGSPDDLASREAHESRLYIEAHADMIEMGRKALE